MHLNHLDQAHFKQLISTSVFKYIDPEKYKLIVFGSRVSGKANDGSDIDIGIIGDTPVPDSDFSKLKDAIAELPILYKVDIVDFARVSDKFKTIALEHYEQF